MAKTQFLVFDIETVPLDWDTFSDSQQEYITRNAKDDADVEKKKNEMGLSPLTAQVVCIGMQLMSQKSLGEYELKKRAAISVDNNMNDEDTRKEELSTGDECHFYNEKILLTNFWKVLKKYHPAHLISFNGRNFDAPFLMMRSALLEVKPSRDIMKGTKFNYSLHTDLIDELTFFSPSFGYGATKKFNFDFYARAFGITSPKSQGLDGSKVPEYFAAGKINEISEYCLRDVTATWELYLKWEKYLRVR